MNADPLTVPFGPYELLERISTGRNEVFRARRGGKLLAVKRTPVHPAEELSDAFIDEAKTGIVMSHANIAQVYDVGMIEDRYIIALEYVPGVSLQTVMSRLSAQHALFVGLEVCKGLEYAHGKLGALKLKFVPGLSARRVLLSPQGEVKITGFCATPAEAVLALRAMLVQMSSGQAFPGQTLTDLKNDLARTIAGSNFAEPPTRQTLAKALLEVVPQA